eukprot:Rhum_TRINITY_DN10479_c1_g1::Rhum_TRINITY_DN10479_c1_g1_i1::g.38294::m.38294
MLHEPPHRVVVARPDVAVQQPALCLAHQPHDVLRQVQVPVVQQLRRDARQRLRALLVRLHRAVLQQKRRRRVVVASGHRALEHARERVRVLHQLVRRPRGGPQLRPLQAQVHAARDPPYRVLALHRHGHRQRQVLRRVRHRQRRLHNVAAVRDVRDLAGGALVHGADPHALLHARRLGVAARRDARHDVAVAGEADVAAVALDDKLRLHLRQLVAHVHREARTVSRRLGRHVRHLHVSTEVEASVVVGLPPAQEDLDHGRLHLQLRLALAQPEEPAAQTRVLHVVSVQPVLVFVCNVLVAERVAREACVVELRVRVVRTLVVPVQHQPALQLHLPRGVRAPVLLRPRRQQRHGALLPVRAAALSLELPAAHEDARLRVAPLELVCLHAPLSLRLRARPSVLHALLHRGCGDVDVRLADAGKGAGEAAEGRVRAVLRQEQLAAAQHVVRGGDVQRRAVVDVHHVDVDGAPREDELRGVRVLLHQRVVQRRADVAVRHVHVEQVQQVTHHRRQPLRAREVQRRALRVVEAPVLQHSVHPHLVQQEVNDGDLPRLHRHVQARAAAHTSLEHAAAVKQVVLPQRAQVRQHAGLAQLDERRGVLHEQVQRTLVLRVLVPGQRVVRHAVRVQPRAQPRRKHVCAPLKRDMQRRPPAVVLRQHVRSGVEQQRHHLKVPAVHCEVQGRLAAPVRRLHLDEAVPQQEGHNVVVALLRALLQDGAAQEVLRVRVVLADQRAELLRRLQASEHVVLHQQALHQHLLGVILRLLPHEQRRVRHHVLPVFSAAQEPWALLPRLRRRRHAHQLHLVRQAELLRRLLLAHQRVGQDREQLAHGQVVLPVRRDHHHAAVLDELERRAEVERVQPDLRKDLQVRRRQRRRRRAQRRARGGGDAGTTAARGGGGGDGGATPLAGGLGVEGEGDKLLAYLAEGDVEAHVQGADALGGGVRAGADRHERAAIFAGRAPRQVEPRLRLPRHPVPSTNEVQIL